MQDIEIHTVRAAFHAQFAETMRDCGIDPDKYFHQFGLPLSVDDGEQLLPEKPFWRLINAVAMLEHIPDFGMRVAQQTPWYRIDSISPYLQGCRTLEQLLERFCQLASSQSSNVTFALQKKPICEFQFLGAPVVKNDIQMELYRVTSMIELVHLATGSEWRPPRIRLMMHEYSSITVSKILANSELCFAEPLCAISLDRNLLSLPINLTDEAALKFHPVPSGPLKSEFESSVRQILASYACNGEMTVDDLARLTDLSVRSLQRQLASRQLNFNQMANEARYEHAKNRLSHETIPISEISASMGYSDPAHFTRAFRRWSGTTPSEYRKRFGHAAD